MVEIFFLINENSTSVSLLHFLVGGAFVHLSLDLVLPLHDHHGGG